MLTVVLVLPVLLVEGLLLLHVPAVQLAASSSGTRAVICICTPPAARSALLHPPTPLSATVVSCVLLRVVGTPGGSRYRVACWRRRRRAGAVAARRGCVGWGSRLVQVAWEGMSALRPASRAKVVLSAATKLLSHVTCTGAAPSDTASGSGLRLSGTTSTTATGSTVTACGNMALSVSWSTLSLPSTATSCSTCRNPAGLVILM